MVPGLPSDIVAGVDLTARRPVGHSRWLLGVRVTTRSRPKSEGILLGFGVELGGRMRDFEAGVVPNDGGLVGVSAGRRGFAGQDARTGTCVGTLGVS